jgi:serine/threonine protein kinase
MLTESFPYIIQTRNEAIQAIKVSVANLWLYSGLNDVSDFEIDLICQLLTIDSDIRMSAADTLQHDWFVEISWKEWPQTSTANVMGATAGRDGNEANTSNLDRVSQFGHFTT